MPSRGSQPVTSDLPAAPDLHDRAVRARMSGPGFRTFLAVAEMLGLTVSDRTRLLGDVAESTYHRWRSSAPQELLPDQLERISLVLGIFKGLRLLFTDDTSALRWLRARNSDLPFSSQSPLEAMLRGSIDDLYGVRRYVDAWRGGRP